MNFYLLRNVSPKALCLAEDIAALAYRQAGSKNKSCNKAIGTIALYAAVMLVFKTYVQKGVYLRIKLLSLPGSVPVTISQNIQSGEPVFTNTRVPVKNLFDYLKAGHSLNEFLEDFPSVKKKNKPYR